MFEEKIYKLRDTKTFKEYERRLKKEMEKVKKNEVWIWFKLLNIPEKYKRALYETLGIEKIYNIRTSPNITFSNNSDKEFETEEEKYDKIIKIVEKYIGEFTDSSNRIKARKLAAEISKAGIELVNLESENYPKDLKNLVDYPLMFFARGNLKLLEKKKIGIVGARNCSLYGMNITRKISKKLSDKGYIIVSGLAKGIDKAAHIEANGKTISVLGTGLLEEVFYPKENIPTYKDILKKGGLVISEFMLDEKATKYSFPKRNRIIAGLSSSLIVTEAAKKSGSLITADFASDLGKDIYTIPGDILSAKYDGNNDLIKDGAIPIVRIEDVDIYFEAIENKEVM